MIGKNNPIEKHIESNIRAYLAKVVHMSLATCHDTVPWITEVHFSYDDALNLYFRSKPYRRHSEEIAQNNTVAGNIVKEHCVGEPVSGVYFEGMVTLLDHVSDGDSAYITYRDRFHKSEAILEEAEKPT